MSGDLILHAIHISERRMIECGVDGLSRGMANEGVMKGDPMVYFLPVHIYAIDRSDGMLSLIKTWWLRCEKLNYLSPKGWHSQVFERGLFLWTPPPATSDAALK